jgi:DNA-binding LacI/PurR family transcriptional regulator
MSVKEKLSNVDRERLRASGGGKQDTAFDGRLRGARGDRTCSENSGSDGETPGGDEVRTGRPYGEGVEKPATIRDIARLAGVSTATVSYVLNDKSGVSDEVRERVKAIMAREGYTQNLRAKGLKTRRSYAIHAVIRKEAAPACKTFYFGVIACMAERLSCGSYSIVPVFQSDDEEDDTLTGLIKKGDTDGVIAFQGLMPRVAAALEEKGAPCVVINPGFEADPRAVSVKIDFEELSHRAASYLIACGHTDIAFIGMRALPSFFSATKRGFQRAMRENGLTVRKEWVTGEATCSEGAADAMRRILSASAEAPADSPIVDSRLLSPAVAASSAGDHAPCSCAVPSSVGGSPLSSASAPAAGRRPTAVLCVQDNFAISAMRAAREAGCRVPEDISFIGIDDVPEARYIEPPLTTIPISPQTLADEALDRLFALIEGEQAESVTIPNGEVIARASVAPRQPAANQAAGAV